MTKIQWTDETWNPTTGCTKVSPGCQNCYAEAMSKRLKAMNVNNYRNNFELTTHVHMLDKPLDIKKSKLIFVNSMSDLFHIDVPNSFIHRVFATMRNASWHNFQVLTKRADRILELNNILSWRNNIWMGVSVESVSYKYRIDLLRKTNAYIKFLSIEPLLSSVGELNLKGIDQVIVGGESGPKSRPMEYQWVMEILEQCKAQNVSFFFKQWGGVNKKKTGRLLNGKIYDEMPKKIIWFPK